MSDIIVKTHDFETAKKRIKEFSEKETEEITLNRVAGKKSVGKRFADILLHGDYRSKHNVTGDELNDLTTQLHNHLIGINEQHIGFRKEFGEVYNALEALDKDYIQAILTSIKATEKTSERIAVTQEQIKRIIDDQKKTLEILKKFKQKLDGYSHLQDIDKIWSDLHSFSETIFQYDKKVHTISETIKSQEKILNELQKYKEQLDKYQHLKDIDKLWVEFQEVKMHKIQYDKKVDDILTTIDFQIKNISDLNEFKQKIDSYTQLENIDEIFFEVQQIKDDFAYAKEQFVSLNESNSKYEESNKILLKKIKIAYILAGGSVGATAISLILNVLGML